MIDGIKYAIYSFKESLCVNANNYPFLYVIVYVKRGYSQLHTMYYIKKI